MDAEEPFDPDEEDGFDPYEVATLAPLFGQRMPIPIDDHASIVAALLRHIRAEADAGTEGLCNCAELVVADLASYRLPEGGHRVVVVTGTVSCPHLTGQASIILRAQSLG